MESRSIAFPIFILLSILVFAEKSHARAQITDEDYWKAVWPNTAIPNVLQELLKPVPSVKLNEKQYPSGFFFNNEIYPGKTMTFTFDRTWTVMSWDNEAENYTRYTDLEICEQRGSSTEDKYCAESLRTLMDYVISKLGKNVTPLLSSFVRKQDQYRVEGVTNMGQKTVMCHKMNSQKVTFYCHEIHGTSLYSVPLVAGNGSKTQALAVCHFDTSGVNKKWLRDVMKIDPGTKPICHFIGNQDIAWVPNN